MVESNAQCPGQLCQSQCKDARVNSATGRRVHAGRVQRNGRRHCLQSATGAAWAQVKGFTIYDAQFLMQQFKPSTLSTAQKIVPFVAVAAASSVNTVAMRNAELTSGIEVMSPSTGEVLGTSQEAAKEAIGLTVISRVVIAAGCLLSPPLAMTILERREFLTRLL